MEQIWLNRKDIRKIQKILDKFPEVESFEGDGVMNAIADPSVIRIKINPSDGPDEVVS